MKQRFGGLLCLAFGAVLIGGNLANQGSALGGVVTPTCQLQVGETAPCPTGTITISESTVQTMVQRAEAGGHAAPAARLAPGAPTPPSSWTVTITSTNCSDPSGATLSDPVSIPNGASGTSTALFVFTSPQHATSCSYVLTVTPVVGFTASLAPTSPVTIPFNGGGSTSSLAVALTESVLATSTSAAPSTSSTAPSTSAVPSTSATPSTSTAPESGSAGSTVSTSAGSAVAGAAPPIANTGPHEQVRASLWIGVGLCVLGFVLLLTGQTPRRRRHHS